MDYFFFFFFNDTATTEIYTLSLHDALPISWYLLAYRLPNSREFLGGVQEPLRGFGRHGWGNRYFHKSKDRKSTRLNSSHSQISYAVFCLKKKKKPKQVLRSSLDLSCTHDLS